VSRRPIATVTVMRMPHIAEGCVRIEVECSESTTGLTSILGPSLPMTDRQFITNAVYAHEERCGDCDVSQAHERGDSTLREEVEAAYAMMRTEVTRHHDASRRN
jgi:hypothetical protein